MAGLSFGIFDHLDRRDLPVGQIYDERLRLLELADAAGFWSYHLAEHHATPLATSPSPALFLAAASQRTKHIRLGPLVYLLPLYQPLRLAEEICILDHLCGGRLDLGIGRGVSPFELAYHGVDAAESRARFHEALQVVVQALTQQRLTHDGDFYHYHDVPIELHPLQQPYPPLWYPTTSDDGLRYAGRHGMNVVLAGRAAAVHAQATLYREAWQAHREDRDRLNGHVAEPWIGASYKLCVAETDDEALAIARRAHRAHHTSLVKLWHDHGVEPTGGFTDDLDLMLRRGVALVGTPDRVREQIERFRATSGCNYLVCHVQYGDMTFAEAERSLRLFAAEVMPAFSTPAPVAG